MVRAVIGISTLFQRGKAQIPSEVRKRLELKEKDKIYFLVDDDDRIWIEKAPEIVKREKLGKY